MRTAWNTLEEILKVNISIVSFESFLKSISDKWLKYGFPVTDELLASETNSGRYIRTKVSMANIFLKMRNYI